MNQPAVSRTQIAGAKRSSLFRAVALIGILPAMLLPGRAHNLDTRATTIAFADDFIDLMSTRASTNQPLIQENDEFWMLLKTTPGPGTATGVGGYQTFYVPDGMDVLDVAYTIPDPSDQRGFRAIPMKGQSPIAIGNGSVGPKTTPELIGWSLPGANGLGVKFDPVSASGTDRGTLAGVYADTGVFFSTDPRTVHNSYGAAISGGSAPMSNNSGDDVGEYFADNVNNSEINGVFGTMTLWDSYQLRAYGRKDVSPIIDPGDGRGNAPWGLANAVAGPQSGYAWEFDYAAYQSTSGTAADKMRAAIKIGPWQRIKYPGSQISSDQPGLISKSLGYAGIDASLMGTDPTALPSGITAVRFAIGQLELGRPEYSAVKVKISSLVGNADDCFPMYADAFGGDAGGTDGGKDHLWRYFDPTVVKLGACVGVQKVASKKLVAPGENFYFDLTFFNNGGTTLPDITLTDSLPTGLQYVSSTPSPFSVSGSTYVWKLGAVPSGSIETIRLYVKATGKGTIFNTVTAKTGATVVGVATDSVEVGTRAILIKSKSVTPSSAAPGSTVEYSMTVDNVGTGTSGTPMVIRDYLPAGFTFDSFVSATLNGASISNPTISINSSNAAEPVFTISQGIQREKSLVIRFNALIGADVASGTYYNQYDVQYEGKKLPPIPEAPVEVGGGRIGDTVFLDWDGNGTQDVGEAGMQGVTVSLYHDADSNGSFETLVGTQVTDSAGNYLFTGLQAGSYQVSVPAPGSGGVPSSYVLTADPDGAPSASTYDVALSLSQSFLDADFGYQPVGSGSIGDQVFEDLDKDGIHDGGEPGIASVTVDLYVDTNADGSIDSGDLLLATTSTNGSGIYSFTGLATDRDYLVQVDPFDGDIASYFTGLYGASANQLTSTNPTVVSSGFTSVTTADFGFWRAVPAVIGDQVFVDNNSDGIYDGGDAPLGNITVNLFASDGVTLVATTTTDLLGQYFFDDVAAGTYVVEVDTTDPDIPGGYSASVLSWNPTVVAGDSFLTADFPFVSVFNKEVDKASALPGDLLTYSLYPYWPGPSLLSAATVTDAVPEGTAFVSATQGGSVVGITGSAAIEGSDPGVTGSSGSLTLTAVADNEIWSDQPSANYGTLDRMWIERTNSYLNRLPIQFDLSGVPSNATITSAVMTLQRRSGDSSNPAIAAHRLTQAWSETTSSWSNRSTGTPWSSPGGDGDYDPTPSATTNVTSNGVHSWTLTSLVQGWVDSTYPNYGVLMRLTDQLTSGQHEFYTREEGDPSRRPKLAVSYSIAPVPATTTLISVSPASVLDNGSGSNVTVTMDVTATGAVSSISPMALVVNAGVNGANATLVSGPTGSPTSIGSGGGSAQFTWVYNVTAGSVEDQVTFSGAANGTGATFSAATSNGVVVKDASTDAVVSWNLGGNSAAVDGNGAGTPGSGTVNAPTDADSWLNTDSSGTNYGSATTMTVNSAGGGMGDGRSIMRFDLSGVPNGATITGAVFKLNCVAVSNTASRTLRLYPVNQAWVEDQVTWNLRSTGNNWSTAGGSAGSELANANVANTGLYSWSSASLTSLVQSWIDSPSGNLGLLIADTASGTVTKDFATKEHATESLRPVLEVSYTGGPPSASTTTSMSVLPSLVTDAGAGANVNVSMTVTADDAVTGITPGALVVSGTNGAGATLVSGPTGSPADIDVGGGTRAFTWVYNVTAGSLPGEVTFTGTPTGTGATFGAASSNGVIVTQPLTMTVQIDSPDPGVPFIENTAQFYDGPAFLAQDSATTGLGASIGNFVWVDLDGDGLQDPGEPGIGGVTVNLYAADGVTLLDTVATDASGTYHFYGLSAGDYVVRYDGGTAPSGYFGTTPGSVAVSLANGEQFVDADFGLDTLLPGTGSIGDYVWIDADGDGVQEGGEPPLEGVTVTLERWINGNWIVVGTDTTDAAGLYAFSGLSAADYRVTVDGDSQITSPYASGAFALGGATAPTFDRDGTGTPDVALVTLASDSTVVDDSDFGYNWTGSIGDYVWWDDNFNGIQDETPDRAIANAEVQLYHDADGNGEYDLFAGDVLIASTYTDANGGYLFASLPPGNYLVKVYDDSIDGEVVTTTEEVLAPILAGGDSFLDADFGFTELAKVEASIFYDANGNGFNDGSETLLAGITVTLSGTDSLGNPVLVTATSSSSGDVAFLVPEGTYTIGYDTGEVATLYPLLTTRTTVTSFVFDAVAGESGERYFEFGLDDSGAIGDTIFADQNGDGSQQLSEPGLGNVTVNLYLDANGDGTIDYGAGDLLLETILTNSAGFYQFTGLSDTTGLSEYMVEVVTSTISADYLTVPTAYPAGADTLASTYSTALSAGEVIDLVDFGYPLVPATYYTLSGTVYHDSGDGGGVSGDGAINGSEAGIGGVNVLVEIDADNNGSYDQSFLVPSDGGGFYSVGGILEGSEVRVTVIETTLPNEAYVQTGDPDGGALSPVWLVTGISTDEMNVDFGYLETLGSIGGTIVLGGGNGLADPGEPAVDGVQVSLRYAGDDGILGTADDVVTQASTAPDGTYSFGALVPGPYEVTTSVPSGLNSLADADGGATNSISVSLGVGEDVVTRDFECEASSISGVVWEDLDADGVLEGGEPLISGVTVFLDLDSNGSHDAGEPTAVTDGSGYYEFTGLASGTFDVRVDVTTLPSGSRASYDIDGTASLHVATVTVAPNEDQTDVDFGYYQPGTISGFALSDTDNDDIGEAPLENVLITLLDASGNDIDSDPVTGGIQPTTTLAAADGSYSFGGLDPGDYRVVETDPSGYISVGDTDGANNNVIGDETPVTVTSGSANSGNDFVDEQLCTISGSVLADTDDNGTGDVGLAGVVITLTDAAGDPIDGDPVASGVQPVSATTDGTGAYGFNNVPPGSYGVAEAQPSGYQSVSDGDSTAGGDDAANVDDGDDFIPVSVFDGEIDSGNDFIEIELSTISGHVFVDSTPLAGVMLTLLDEFGNEVDGDPGTPGVQAVTAVTDSSGFYQFTNVPPGTYQVRQTQPIGYESFGDVDGGDLDIIGDVTPIVVAPGEESPDNNFVETVDTCPDDWDEWLYQHPGEWADGNPDLDAYDNLAEFAFAMPADDGSGSGWLGQTAWIIQPSSLAPGTLEGVFVRPTGALLDVTYALEYAAGLGDPVVWQSLTLEPSHYTTVDNGDCTETVTIHDLEGLTSLTGGGVVRLRVDLDEEPDTVIDHTTYSEVEGWTEAGLPLCCVTYNDPYQRETLFTGTVGAVSGQDLVFTVSGGSFDLDTLLVPGAAYYIEVNSGDLEGHRFDVESASNNTLTLTSDSDLHAALAPFNTLTGAPPAALSGDVVMLRRHTTLAEHFPPASFGAAGSQTSADEVQVFAAGGWTSYWLFDDAGSSRWVEVTDATMADQGEVVIPPGQGVFFYNRTGATSMLQYGEIRSNDFVRPLMDGDNLVGGGFPLDQSATGTAGRAMNTGFTGTLDFKTADSFYIWRKDSEGPSARGYHSHFRVDGTPYSPSLLRWAQVGDSVLTERGNDEIFLGSHAVFLRSQAGFDAYTMPKPWVAVGP